MRRTFPNPIAVAEARIALLDRMIPNATGYDRQTLEAERARCERVATRLPGVQAENRRVVMAGRGRTAR